MEIITVIGYVLFMGIFIFSLTISWKFQFSMEGKDERGQRILNYAYSLAFPVFPVGWLLLLLYDDFIHTIDYSVYKWLIWCLVILSFSVHGLTVFFLKRKW